MQKAELTALAERVQALTGPCRETDALIAVQSGLYVHEKRKGDRQMWFYPTTPGKYRKGFWSAGFERLDDYTASLDAAMTLVPDGCLWTLEGPAAWARWLTADDVAEVQSNAATPALALTAAALFARAALEQKP